MHTLTGHIVKKICCNKNKYNYFVILKVEDVKNTLYIVKAYLPYSPDVDDAILVEYETISSSDENTIDITQFGSIQCELPSEIEKQMDRLLTVLKRSNLIQRKTSHLKNKFQKYCQTQNDHIFENIINSDEPVEIKKACQDYLESRNSQLSINKLRIFLYSHQIPIDNKKLQKIVDTIGTESINLLQSSNVSGLNELLNVPNLPFEYIYRLAIDFQCSREQILDLLLRRVFCKISGSFDTTTGQLFEQGDVYCVLKELKNLKDLTLFGEVSLQEIYNSVKRLTIRDVLKVIKNENEPLHQIHVYYKMDFIKEKTIAQELCNIYNTDLSMLSRIDTSHFHWNPLNVEQQQAIQHIFQHRVSIINGKAGTGKSFVVQKAIDLLIHENHEIQCLILAPTGKATSRYACNKSLEYYNAYIQCHRAYTIHKFISYISNTQHSTDEDKKILQLDKLLSQDDHSEFVLFIDEMSMVSNELMFDLLMALKEIKCQLTLVFMGDTNQLPCIGEGDVFQEMINSNYFPITTLQQVCRQQSEFIGLCHAVEAILQKELPQNGLGFELILNLSEEGVFQKIKQIVGNISCRDYYDNYICITPTHQSIQKHQPLLRNFLHRQRMIVSPLIIDDIVMQTVNNYQLQVFNGMIGRIIDIVYENNQDESTRMMYHIDFENNYVKYNSVEITELKLSFVNTIHCMQGSEKENVILVIPIGYNAFVNYKMIYTAVSRAKKRCIIFCPNQYLFQNILNRSIKKRKTNLCKFIIQTL